MSNAGVFVVSAEKEFLDPIEGEVIGKIPSWLCGSLYRNGPAKFEVGEDSYNHYFDGLAMVQKFEIKDGKVHFRSQFLKSETYKRNMAANRIVVSEFGTVGHPDPCKSLFARYFAMFRFGDPTDNTAVNVFPIADELYCATETNFINRIDHTTLNVMERQNLKNYVAVNSATAHPHIDHDGSVHNLGMSYEEKGGPFYSIIRIEPHKREEQATVLETASIKAQVRVRWRFNPSYNHSFGMTKNYYVLLESPLIINVGTLIFKRLTLQPLTSSIQWQKGSSTNIYLLSKETGEVVNKYTADDFFTFHHINAYEEDGHVVMDAACYRTGDVILNVSKERFSRSKDLSSSDPPIAKRFVLPLNIKENNDGENLVRLMGSKARAYLSKTDSGQVCVEPEVLCDLPMDMPTINYARCNARRHRFVYGIHFVGDADGSEKLVKIDVETRETLLWSEPNCFPCEPIFVAKPNGGAEDDGVLLSPIIRLEPGGQRSHFLLILDARTMEETARVQLPQVSVPKTFHGSFLPDRF